MATTQALLDQVEAAISAQLAGGVAQFNEGLDGARMIPLGELMQMRLNLQRQLAAENGSIGLKAVQPIRQ